MRKMAKRPLSILLSLALMLSMVVFSPVSASASRTLASDAPKQVIDGINVWLYVDNTVADIDEAATAALSDAQRAAGYQVYDATVDFRVYYPRTQSLGMPTLVASILKSAGGNPAYATGLSDAEKTALFGFSEPSGGLDVSYKYRPEISNMPDNEADGIFRVRSTVESEEGGGGLGLALINYDSYGNKYFGGTLYFYDIVGVAGDSHDINMKPFCTSSGANAGVPVADFDSGEIPEFTPGTGTLYLPYAVTYDDNGAENITDPATQLPENVTVATVENPYKVDENSKGKAFTKTNAVFYGWSTDKANVEGKVLTTLTELNALSDLYKCGEQITVDESKNFFAVWLYDSGNDFPDMFEQDVDLNIVNGTWISDPANPTTRTSDTVTVKVKITKDGTANTDGDPNGFGYVELPTTLDPQANPGYGDGEWYEPLTTQVRLNTDPADPNPEFTLTYTATGYKVIYSNVGTNVTGTAPEDTNTYTVTNDTATILGNDVITDPLVMADHVFIGWSKSANQTVGRNGVFPASFYKPGDNLQVTETITLYPVFAESHLGDPTVPDMYEKKVIYNVIGGTFGNGGPSTTEEWVVLYDSNGEWDANGTGTITVPTNMVKTDNNYSLPGAWNVDPMPTTVSGPATTDATFTYSYKLGALRVYYEANGGNGTYEDTNTYGINTDVPVYDGTNFTKEKAVAIGYTKNTGYNWGAGIESLSEIPSSMTFIPKDAGTTQIGTNDMTLFVVWAKDSNEDGIPDMYQKQITFKIVNGTWIDPSDSTSTRKADDVIAWVNLYDTNGDYAEDGKGTLLATQIPTSMEPDATHTIPGTWDDEAGLTALQVADAVDKNSTGTFTYTFSGEKFQITYDANGATGNAPVDPEYYVVGADVTLLAPTNLTAPVDTNGKSCMFIGWSTTQTAQLGEGDSLPADLAKDGETMAMVDGGLKVYAVWSKSSNGIDPDVYTKTITFNIENGSWTVNGSVTTDPVEIKVPLKNTAGDYDVNGTGTIDNSKLPSNPNPSAGYTTPGAWNDEAAYNAAIAANGVNSSTPSTFTYSYSTQVFNVTYHADGISGDVPTDNNSYLENADVTMLDPATAPASLVKPANSAFLGWTTDSTWDSTYVVPKTETAPTYTEVGKTIAMPNGGLDVYAVYGEDSNDDDIPDKYQKQITFKIENGTWIDPSDSTRKADEVIAWVNLYDTNGDYAEDGKGTLLASQIPTGMEPVAGYAAPGAWDNEAGLTALQVADAVDQNSTGTFTYTFDQQTFNVTYHADGISGNVPVDNNTYLENADVTMLDPATAPASLVKPANSAFLGWTTDNTWVSSNVVAKTDTPPAYTEVGKTIAMPNGGLDVYAVYGEDSNDDDIPDMYQKFITLHISNGKWINPADTTATPTNNDVVVAVNLYDTNGNYAEDGTGKLNPADLPTNMTADLGYNQSSGKWDDEAGLTALQADNAVSSTSKSEFTYSFDESKIEIQDPEGNVLDILKIYRYSPYTSSESGEPGGYTDTEKYFVKIDGQYATSAQIQELINSAKVQLLKVTKGTDSRTAEFVDADIDDYLFLGPGYDGKVKQHQLQIQTAAPATVKLIMTYGGINVEVVVVTPADVDGVNGLRTTDWKEVRGWLNESHGYEDDNLFYEFEFNGKTYNAWSFMADMDGKISAPNVRTLDWKIMKKLLNESY